MKNSGKQIIDELISRYPSLKGCESAITEAAEAISTCYRNGGKVLTCGNGGSAADSLHIVGELMKSFVLHRELPEADRRSIRECAGEDADLLCSTLECALPAIALVTETALTTAYTNDASADAVFAQQVYGYGAKGDVLIAISTSGNSKNVVLAAKTAHAKGMTVISLTGERLGKLSAVSDILIAVPEKETFKIQELHLPVYHALCLAIENEFFGE